MSRLRDAIAKTLLSARRPLVGHETGRLHANVACSTTPAIRETSTMAASRWQGHISVQEAKVKEF